MASVTEGPAPARCSGAPCPARRFASEGSQRRNGHDQEYPRSGMDSGDGGGLTGYDAQPYAAHISP